MIRQSKAVHAAFTKFQLYSWSEIKDDPGLIRDHEQEIMLTRDTAKELFEYGKQINQKVFFTPMYLEAVDICEEIGVDLYKIRCADRHNITLIRKVLDTDKRIIMSIDRQYEPSGLVLTHTHRIDFLLCVPKYPASVADYMLNKSTFNHFSGISDHTPNLELARQALKTHYDIIIEKHVKLNDTCIEKNWSVSFSELKSLRESEKWV